MKVVPLAAESLGVRSMATYVEVGKTGVLLDPGAALAPTRFNLPPADEEWEALRRANDRIAAYAARAGIVFISHYHEEHFLHEPAAYAGRWVLAKDPRRMIAGPQGRRASELWRGIGATARVEAADGRAHDGLDLSFRVSPPLPHGAEGTTLGYVVAITLVDRAEDFRFVFAGDVQGPLSAVATAYLIRERPHLLYLSGPPTYLEKQLGPEVIDRAIDNLRRIIDATGCRVIMDHYALRDADAPERFRALWEGGRVVTAAGHLGLRDSALEARRHVLWAAQRKPAAKMEWPRAIVSRKPGRYARGGTLQ
jgi:predicted metallo-beta-lactamase superfamily hydrolase